MSIDDDCSCIRCKLLRKDGHRVIYKGELYPSVKVLIGVAESNPAELLYVIDCDVVHGIPADTLTGTVTPLTEASSADGLIRILRQLYQDWAAKYYTQERRNVQ